MFNIHRPIEEKVLFEKQDKMSIKVTVDSCQQHKWRRTWEIILKSIRNL